MATKKTSNTEQELLEALKDGNERVRRRAAANHSATPEVLLRARSNQNRYTASQRLSTEVFAVCRI